MDFPLHLYLSKLKKLGAKPDFLRQIKAVATEAINAGSPPIFSLRHLSHALNLPHHYLVSIVSRNIDPYRVFKIRKRSGGDRSICAPEVSLLRLHRWIHDNILTTPAALKLVNVSATAYRPGSSHKLNASKHLGAPWLIKMDIQSFFESISERQVYKCFRKLGYRPYLAFCLTRICTRVVPAFLDKRLHIKSGRWRIQSDRPHEKPRAVGHLPQGAPTSPMLANLVCIEFDAEIESFAAGSGLLYTRYSDDLVLSGFLESREQAGTSASRLGDIVRKFGFLVNRTKTRVRGPGSRRIVTGLLIGEGQLRLPRSYKDEVRKDLYFLRKFGLDEHCAREGHNNRFSFLSRLLGRIRYIRSIEPGPGGKLEAAFVQTFPHFEELARFLK